MEERKQDRDAWNRKRQATALEEKATGYIQHRGLNKKEERSKDAVK